MWVLKYMIISAIGLTFQNMYKIVMSKPSYSSKYITMNIYIYFCLHLKMIRCVCKYQAKLMLMRNHSNVFLPTKMISICLCGWLFLLLIIQSTFATSRYWDFFCMQHCLQDSTVDGDICEKVNSNVKNKTLNFSQVIWKIFQWFFFFFFV